MHWRKSRWVNFPTKKRRMLSMKSAFSPQSSTRTFARTMRLSWMRRQALSGKHPNSNGLWLNDSSFFSESNAYQLVCILALLWSMRTTGIYSKRSPDIRKSRLIWEKRTSGGSSSRWSRGLRRSMTQISFIVTWKAPMSSLTKTAQRSWETWTCQR